MHPSRFYELIHARWAEVHEFFLVPMPEVEFGDYPHFRTTRGFGVTFFEPKTRECKMRYAEKLLRQPIERIEGIVRHEFGHVVDFLVPEPVLTRIFATFDLGLEPGAERRADQIAEFIWGPIYYDNDLVQNTKHGVTPRPARLGA